jgi:hypothetical protein
MTLVGVRVEVGTNQPIVLLREESGRRHLPIFIGQTEATAIVYALQGMETPRPLTHDLFKEVLETIGSRLQRVYITELRNNTYFAEIELSLAGQQYRISSRPSDAIALAVRHDDDVEIYAEEAVVEEAGVTFPEGEEGDEDEQVEQFREFLEHVTPEDFA